MNRWLTWLLTSFFLAGCAATPARSNTPTPLPSSVPTGSTPSALFRIIGYVTDRETIVERIRFDQLTHINYAFLLPKADGTFATIANPWKLQQIVSKAHAANVKVLISVGGWGYDEQFEALAADPAKRAVFVAGLVQFVRDYDLDGADMDWEYPGPAQASTQNFVALMGELRAALPAGKLLTAAVIALGKTGDDILPEVFSLVDFLNIMAYDTCFRPDGCHSPPNYLLDSAGSSAHF
jgi:GH18 family chitinase